MADETDELASLQSALSTSYCIERELARGGMATVYLAEDAKHRRPVALKVLRPDPALGIGSDRFRREISLVARLQHPHILPILDSGQTTAGQLWFTMPYVEGETLRARLQRTHRLPVDEALTIAREIADALEYAHGMGIIHRDVKPENILLSKGHALLADFGVARPSDTCPPSLVTALTATGDAIGTPAYMSPEQAAGVSVDARSDVYALGLVAYEMLTGDKPFQSSMGLAGILARRRSGAESMLRVRRPDVSEAVDLAIRTATAINPAERHASAIAFARALTESSGSQPIARAHPRWPWIAGAAAALVVGLLAGVGTRYIHRRAPRVAAVAAPRAVAVLPFDNIGDTTNAYFADGVADEVRGKLAAIPGLTVIARASSVQYRHTTKSPQQIARELGAPYLLTGRVRWEKRPDGTSRVQVDPELVFVADSAAPTTTWQQPFDADLSDVFRVQSDIAGRVAAALDVALGNAQRATLAARPTANLAAYDAFIRGEAATAGMSAGDAPSVRRGIAFYGNAVTLDSTFVLAWARLAFAHAVLFVNTGPSEDQADAARDAVDRVRSLAPDRPETRLAESAYAMWVHNDYRAALTAADAGLAIAPRDVDLLTMAALAERALGRWDESLAHFSSAETLDPRSVVAAVELCRTLLVLRRYPDAQQTADHALALAPDNVTGLLDAVMTRLAQGRLVEAKAMVHTRLVGADTAALIAYFGQSYDLYWVLDDVEQRRMLTLAPSDFDGDRAERALVIAEVLALRGDSARMRAYADTADRAFAAQIRATPNDDERRMGHGLALAMLGRGAEAIAEGERGAALRPVSADAFTGPYIQQLLARIYMMSGQPERAIDHLGMTLRIPHYLTPNWLRVDPTWDALRRNPRFEQLQEAGGRG